MNKRMFRELSRIKNKLTHSECVEILKTQKRGVLSVIGDGGYPYGMPMNHFYDERDGKIYFHCGIHGHRSDALKNDCRVSFCTYDEGYRKPDDWALNVRSVIVFGKIKVISDIDRIIDTTTRLCHKFTDDEEYIKSEIQNHAHKTLLLELTPEHICGKAVNES